MSQTTPRPVCGNCQAYLDHPAVGVGSVPGLCRDCSPSTSSAPRGWTPGDTYGVVAPVEGCSVGPNCRMHPNTPAHVDEVIGEGIASEADRPGLLPPFRGVPDCYDCGRQWADCRCEGPLS